MSNTRALLDLIIQKQEGGWRLTDNKDDPDGGWTYAGITASTYWLYHLGKGTVAGRPPTYQEMKGLIEQNEEVQIAKVYEIYDEEFIIPLRLQALPGQIRGPLLSAAINIGVMEAIKCLQRTAPHIQRDGILGPETYKWCLQPLPNQLVRLFLKEWMLYYINLVQENTQTWHDACEVALAACSRYATRDEGPHPVMVPPHTLCANNLEGWFNRVEFWREGR